MPLRFRGQRFVHFFAIILGHVPIDEIDGIIDFFRNVVRFPYVGFDRFFATFFFDALFIGACGHFRRVHAKWFR